jgi:hypothetical protein
VRELRIAGAQDRVRAKINVEFLLHRRPHVDRRQRAETLLGKRRRSLLDRLRERHGQAFIDLSPELGREITLAPKVT